MKILVLLCFCSLAQALPTQSVNRASYFHDECSTFNPCDPCFSWCEAISWRIGYEGDFVYNRFMERRQDTHGLGDIQRFSLMTNGGILTINVVDWFELFTMIGATQIAIRTPARVTALESALQFFPRFSWSLGASGVFWKCNALALGFRGQYFRTMPYINSFYDYASGVITYFNDKQASYYEWQASFGGSYTLQGPAQMECIPHASITAAGAKMGLGGLNFSVHNLLNLKDKKMWGYAIGLSMVMRRKVGLTAEARFADQKALHIVGDLAF